MEVKTNREYKSSMLIQLLSKKENLLETYGALKNKTFSKDTEVLITTLSDALFMERMNDISFVIEDKIVVLIEQQSTVNYNMPIRAAIYLGRIYEKLLKEESIYQEKKIPLPKPEIIVLYNGKDKMPEQQELRLSDAFKDFCDGEIPNMECIVKIININKGFNEELANRSETLKGYESFVYFVREHEKSMSRSLAIQKAVDDCMRQDILRDFLRDNASEVRNMLFTEWNWDTAKRVWQEEAREDGIAIGEARGVAIGEARGEARGETKGVLRTARQMKGKGFNSAVISEITGLSKDEIERLGY